MPNDGAPLVFDFDGRFDKLFKAMASMEARTTAAVKKIDGKFQKANKGVVDGLAKQARGFARLSNVTGAQRFVIQNTANQFGDLAVQIGAGTSPLRAMSLQLPQLFGGFAALGGTLGILAPLLGTVAALGLPIAGVLLGMASASQEAADKAETLEDKVTLLTDANGKYRESVKLAALGAEELKDKYGVLADEAKRALEVQRELRRLASEDARRSAASGVVADITAGVPGGADARLAAVASGMDELQRKAEELRATLAAADPYAPATAELKAKLAETEAAISFSPEGRLASSLGIAVQQARDLLEVMDRLNSAGTDEALARAAKELSDELIRIYGSTEAVKGQFGGLLDKLNDIVTESAEMAKATDDAARAASAVSGAMAAAEGVMSVATSTAEGLADAIWNAARGAWDYAGGLGAAEREKSTDAAGNETNFDVNDRARRPPRHAPNDPDFGLPPISHRRGANVNASEAADLAKIKQLYAATRTEAEKYANELAELNRLKAEGKIGADLFARSIANLGEKFQSTNIDGFKNGVLDLASGVVSVSDALDQMKQAAIRAFAEFAFFGTGPLASAGGSGSIFKSLLGSVLSFDGGGATPGGPRIGGLDGKGGFLAMLHPSEVVQDKTRGDGGNGAPIINVNVVGATGNEEVKRMVHVGVASGLAQNNRALIERQRRS